MQGSYALWALGEQTTGKVDMRGKAPAGHWFVEDGKMHMDDMWK